jgi:hypothetical protein
MSETALEVLSFGVWVSLLCFALCCAGWIGDKVRQHREKERERRNKS